MDAREHHWRCKTDIDPVELQPGHTGCEPFPVARPACRLGLGCGATLRPRPQRTRLWRFDGNEHPAVSSTTPRERERELFERVARQVPAESLSVASGHFAASKSANSQLQPNLWIAVRRRLCTTFPPKARRWAVPAHSPRSLAAVQVSTLLAGGSCSRVARPVFCSMLLTWDSTVLVEMNS
jgi:hypothetical protein